MAPFVHFGIMRDASGPIGLGRDNRCSSAFIEVGAQPVVVESLVTDERRKIETGDQRLDADAVVTLSGKRTKRTRLPRASTKAMILVVRPPRERPMA